MLISVTYPGCIKSGAQGTKAFLVEGMGARGGQGALASNPHPEYNACADFSGVPRIYILEGHKGPGIFWWETWAPVGAQGALPPHPLWNVKTC